MVWPPLALSMAKRRTRLGLQELCLHPVAHARQFARRFVPTASPGRLILEKSVSLGVVHDHETIETCKVTCAAVGKTDP